jgi:hypothetical protein
MSHRNREICGADAEKFLPRVQGISVLCSEGAGGRYAFDIGEQQTTSGQWDYSFNITQPESRARQGR